MNQLSLKKNFKPCKAEGCCRPRFGGGFCSFPIHQAMRTDSSFLRSKSKKEAKVKVVYQIPKAIKVKITAAPRRRTKKREADERQYNKEIKEWLKLPENKWCAVYPNLRSTQVHHKWGRQNDRLLMKKYWLGVSDEGHDFINNHPTEAYRLGYNLYRNQNPENQL